LSFDTVVANDMNYRCYQMTLQWNIFTQIGSGAKCWLDIYRWGTGRAVPGPIHDIGQNVLVFLQNRKKQRPSYCHVLFLIIFLEEAFI